MKIRNLTTEIIVLLTVVACEKEPLTKPVDFTPTTYQTLGTYDTTGRPTYLLTKDIISQGLLSFIKTTLPEKSDLRTTHPELFTTSANADISITQSANVYITFISQRTGTANALAFYTYPANQPPTGPKDIKTITYIFPSAGSGTKLQTGDKVKIGRFDAGTSIGFVLMRDAWNRTTHTLDNNAVHYCSSDILNPEVDAKLKRHAVLVNYTQENKLLVGFEDIDRTINYCDHDFNDAVFYATLTP